MLKSNYETAENNSAPNEKINKENYVGRQPCVVRY